MQYDRKIAMTMADIIIVKLLWNSVLSILKARYMCVNIKDFYLIIQLDKSEYLRILIKLIP